MTSSAYIMILAINNSLLDPASLQVTGGLRRAHAAISQLARQLSEVRNQKWKLKIVLGGCVCVCGAC